MLDFLATVPIFRELTPEQLREVAGLCREERFLAGSSIVKQGGYSQALYFLRSGRAAVNVRRGDHAETVAYLDPPAVIGEISFITGRASAVDIDVLVDAECIVLPKDAMPMLVNREAVLRGMMTVLAERLRDTMTRGGKVKPSPVILLRNFRAWEAPQAFATELARSLGRQSGYETLVVHIGDHAPTDLHFIDDNAYQRHLPAADPSSSRAEIARLLTGWKRRFNNVIFNPSGSQQARIVEEIVAFADTVGDLLGPGDPVETHSGGRHFRVQSAAQPTLPVLDGRNQLIHEAGHSEKAVLSGGEASRPFLRTVDSIARAILGLQVGLALGGGAAWGWAHIGVLRVLEENDIPVDVIAGCSMGSVIGVFRAAGYGVQELEDLAGYWRTRTRRFIEWRFWRMCLLNELAVQTTLRKYFGDRTLNQMDIPYWANAVDIKLGKEYTIVDGPVVDAVRASIALPGLLSPVPRNQLLLLDAGIMDPVPAILAGRMGGNFIVAVNAMAGLEVQEINPRFPFSAFEIMMRCTRVMGHEIGQARAEEAADVVMTPAFGDITMLQFGRATEIIGCGRRAATEHLAAIQAGYRRLKEQQLSVEQPQAVETTF